MAKKSPGISIANLTQANERIRDNPLSSPEEKTRASETLVKILQIQAQHLATTEIGNASIVETLKIAKVDIGLQAAQVYQEYAIKKDEDKVVDALLRIEKQLKTMSFKPAANNVKDKKPTSDDNSFILAALGFKKIKKSKSSGSKKRIIESNDKDMTSGGSLLKTALFGNDTREDVNAKSWSSKLTGGKHSITGWLHDKVSAREEKRDFIRGARSNDEGYAKALKFGGRDAAEVHIAKKYDEVKMKEREIKVSQDKVDNAKRSGYAPKKEDLEAVKKRTAELNTIDPRRKSHIEKSSTVQQNAGVVAPASQIIASNDLFGRKSSPVEKTEDQTEADAQLNAYQESSKLINADSNVQLHTIGATLIASLETQKKSIDAIGNIEGGGSSLADSVIPALAVTSLAKTVIPALKTVASYALPAAAMAVVGMGVDHVAGRFGVGKDEQGNALKVDEKTDDSNWDKMSLWEKAQSGVARGIEKGGSFIGLGNMATQAKVDRVKSETEYFKNKEGLQPVANMSESNISEISRNNANATAESKGTGNTNIVNAPTNINNSKMVQSSSPFSPPRNQESSQSSYITSRFAT